MSAKLTDAIRPIVLLQGVTGFTGGGATNLDGIATVSLAVPVNGFIVVSGSLYFYQLRAGTDSASPPGIIRPTDYNAVSNAKVWDLTDFSSVSIPGMLDLKGTWNASTNTPTLASGTGTKGDVYIVSVTGATNLDGETGWTVRDWAVFDGTAWKRVDNTDQDATASVKGVLQLAGDLGGTAASPTVISAAAQFALAGTVDLQDGGTGGYSYNDWAWNDAGNFTITGSYTTAALITCKIGVSGMTVTGMSGGTAGRVMMIVNYATNAARTITLKANSSSSSAANRFGISTDLVLPGLGGGAILVYDAHASLWRVAHLFIFGGDLSGSIGASVVLQASTSFKLSGGQSPTALGSNTNNWAPTSVSTSAYVRASASTAVSVTGLSILAGAGIGQVWCFHNIGSYAITFTHQDAASTAANRFDLGGENYVLQPATMCFVQYDNTAARYRIVGAGSFLQKAIGGTLTGRLTLGPVSNTQSTLTYGASVAIDFDGDPAKTVSLTGDITFTTSNRAAGKMIKVRIISDGSTRNFTFPAWVPLGTALPANQAASKTAILTLECWGANDTDITASYVVQP